MLIVISLWLFLILRSVGSREQYCVAHLTRSRCYVLSNVNMNLLFLFFDVLILSARIRYKWIRGFAYWYKILMKVRVDWNIWWCILSSVLRYVAISLRLLHTINMSLMNFPVDATSLTIHSCSVVVMASSSYKASWSYEPSSIRLML